MLDIADKWQSENVDLKSARQLVLNCGEATVTACDENNYKGFFEAVVREPVSLVLLEEIGKKVHSDATIHLISQYKGTPEVVNPNTSNSDETNSSVQSFWKKLCDFMCNNKTAAAYIFFTVIGLCLGFALSYWIFFVPAVPIP